MDPKTVWFVDVPSVSLSSVLCPKDDRCPLGILWRTQQHLKNSTYKFLRFLLFPNQCHCASTRRWFDLRAFRTEFYSYPSCFGLPEVTAVLCVLGKLSARTLLVLRQYDPIHDILETTWPTEFCLYKTLLIVDTQRFCQDKAPNQRKRIPLLFTVWQLCRSTK